MAKETVGLKDENKSVVFAVNTSRVKEVINPNDVLKVLESDFIEKQATEKKPMSLNDRKFIDILNDGIHVREDTHYEMPLPFKDPYPMMPNNREIAMNRLMQLKRKLQHNEKFRLDYERFMAEIIDSGYAEEIPENDNPIEGHLFYIPHHGVYHPKKPEKIRVVFDCSSKHQDICLNDVLLQGPDMTNDLIAVLCRFRKESVAIACDVKKMFYQFHVNEDHRNYLRFLWWRNGDLSTEPREYRMTVHLFGAVSSPACANFALKRAAEDGKEEFGKRASEFLKNDFYVDDGLTAVPSPEEAIDLIEKTKSLCKTRGIRLHQFVSNDSSVIESIPDEDRAKSISTISLGQEEVHVERVLGIQWSIDLDCFQFKIVLKDRPATRRGILSTVSSVYDPLGFLAPALLTGKQILQDICREQYDWDEPLPDEMVARWCEWCSNLKVLESIKIPRCVKPAEFKVKRAELHHFSDASTVGYGECSYLRLIDEENQIHCALVFAKARVTPLRQVSIPRLELTAALLSVKIGTMLKQDMAYENIDEFYWSDSKVVLGYIANNARRFHVYVANRVQQIRDKTEPEQWNYVQTKHNPADYASRGLTAKALLDHPTWFDGPEFLYEQELQEYINANHIHRDCSEEDPEVKRVLASSTTETPESIDSRFERFSSWSKAKRVIALCIRYIQILRDRIRKTPNITRTENINVEDLCSAETVIIKAVQTQNFA